MSLPSRQTSRTRCSGTLCTEPSSSTASKQKCSPAEKAMRRNGTFTMLFATRS
jgi:hypothetical protein